MMIILKVLDKKGCELCNGDTVKYCSIRKDYQEERGDNIPGGYYAHQIDTLAKWETLIVSPERDIDGIFYVPGDSYDREILLDLLGLPASGIDDEELYDCLTYLKEQLNLEETLSIEKFIDAVSGFEIIKQEN